MWLSWLELGTTPEDAKRAQIEIYDKLEFGFSLTKIV